MNPEKPAALPSGLDIESSKDKSINVVQGTPDSLPGCLGERRPIFPNVCETCDVRALCEEMQRESAQKKVRKHE